MADPKVLTVSYGRFSCKIEGYEDGVSALKEIAAHFREMAEADHALEGPEAVPVVTAPATVGADEFAEAALPAAQHTPLALRPAPGSAATKMERLRRLAPYVEADWDEDDPSDVVPQAGEVQIEAAPLPQAPEAPEARAARIAAEADAVEAQLLRTVRETGRLGRGAGVPVKETEPVDVDARDEGPQDGRPYAGDAVEGPEPDAARAPGPQDAAARRARQGGSMSEASVSRLMDTANDKFNDADGLRRFDALKRLRHAVLATVADRSAEAGRAPLPDNRRPEGRPYAEDLAQVVRASRTSALAPRAEAPLVLGAAQRVDAAAPPTTLPERLRTAARAAAQDADDDTFSRPEVMLLVEAQGPVAGGREEVLRAFGTLLREGRFRRVAPGRYVQTD